MKSDNSVAFICYDIETGGLNENKNPIIELAFLPLVRNKKGALEVKENLGFETLIIQPYDNKLVIEASALKANNIKEEDINKYGNTIEDIKVTFENMIKILNPKNNDKLKPILVGHNIGRFDNKFLRKFFNDNGFRNIEYYFSEAFIDTYAEARRLFDGDARIQSLSLGNLCNYFGIELKGAHRAYNDCKANAELFLLWTKMFEMNRKKILDLNKNNK